MTDASSSSRSSVRPSSSASSVGSSDSACGPPLGERRVAFVKERSDVAEKQRPRERRRLSGLDLHDAHGPVGHGPHEPTAAPAGRTRPARTRAAPRARSGTSRTSTRPRAAAPIAAAAATAACAGAGRGGGAAAPARRTRGTETRTGPSRRPRSVTASSTSSGSSTTRSAPGTPPGSPRSSAVSGMRSTMPSSAWHRLDVDAVPLAEAGADGERPGSVDLCSERGVDDHPPVAELVAEPLDQRGCGRPGCARWPRAARAGSRAGCRWPSRPGRPRRRAAGRRRRATRTISRTNAPTARAELGGTSDDVALPEREAARLAGRGRDEHPVVGDVLDPPDWWRRARTRRRPATRRPSPRRARRLARHARSRRGTRRTSRGLGSCRRW